MRRKYLVLLLTLAPGLALAQAGEQVQPPAEPPPAEAPPPPPPPQAAQQPQQPQQPAPQAAPQPTPQPIAGPAGQWVYTAQYGWLWVPYAREYTYVPGDAQVFPDQYVYYPAYGWRWVVAPWVYGYGPAPYWGVYGPRYYVWYSRPWFRVGGYWGWGAYRGWGPGYRGWVGPRVWGPRGWAGAPAYYRTGVGGPHPHAFRPEGHREVRGGRERRGHER